MTDTGDDVSHPVEIYDELLQAILRLSFQRDSDVQWHAERHRHPHRSGKTWSGALLLVASLNVGRSHTGPTVWRG